MVGFLSPLGVCAMFPNRVYFRRQHGCFCNSRGAHVIPWIAVYVGSPLVFGTCTCCMLTFVSSQAKSNLLKDIQSYFHQTQRLSNNVNFTYLFYCGGECYRVRDCEVFACCFPEAFLFFQSVCPSTPVLFVGLTHTVQSVSLSPLCWSPFLFVHLSVSEDLFQHYSLFLSFFYSFFLFMFVSFSRLFCSSCLEALSHPVAGVLPFPLGRPPRPSLWPLNISTSQVGAGASSPCFSSLETFSALSLFLHSFIWIPSIMHLCFFLFIVLMVDFAFLLCWVHIMSQISQKFWSSCICIAFPQIMIIADTICNLGGIKNVLLKLDLYFLIHRPRH